MSNGESDEVETPEDMENEEAAMMHIGRYVESRRALPYEQWTFREKANYYMDRVFLGFLAVFLLVLFAEVCYKIWYVTNLTKIAAFLTDAGGLMFGWLFAQEEKEERFDL